MELERERSERERIRQLACGQAVLVNTHRGVDTQIKAYAAERGLITYIGREAPRARPPRKRSVWHNPYRIGREAWDPAEAVWLFRAYFATRQDLQARLHELAGRALECWCYPNHACHGDVLIEELGVLGEGANI